MQVKYNASTPTAALCIVCMYTLLNTSLLHKHTAPHITCVGVILTRKVAMAVPMTKPAMTSDQWLRYSATRFRPVRNARHMSPRDSTGLARRVPFACTVHVTYICQRREMDARIRSSELLNIFVKKTSLVLSVYLFGNIGKRFLQRFRESHPCML